MKVIIDTNIIFSALLQDGQKYRDNLFFEVDALVSWNFKHMVKLKTIRGVNGINRMLGFKELEILTPQSWIQEDNNE